MHRVNDMHSDAHHPSQSRCDRAFAKVMSGLRSSARVPGAGGAHVGRGHRGRDPGWTVETASQRSSDGPTPQPFDGVQGCALICAQWTTKPLTVTGAVPAVFNPADPAGRTGVVQDCFAARLVFVLRRAPMIFTVSGRFSRIVFPNASSAGRRGKVCLNTSEIWR